MKTSVLNNIQILKRIIGIYAAICLFCPIGYAQSPNFECPDIDSVDSGDIDSLMTQADQCMQEMKDWFDEQYTELLDDDIEEHADFEYMRVSVINKLIHNYYDRKAVFLTVDSKISKESLDAIDDALLGLKELAITVREGITLYYLDADRTHLVNGDRVRPMLLLMLPQIEKVEHWVFLAKQIVLEEVLRQEEEAAESSPTTDSTTTDSPATDSTEISSVTGGEVDIQDANDHQVRLCKPLMSSASELLDTQLLEYEMVRRRLSDLENEINEMVRCISLIQESLRHQHSALSSSMTGLEEKADQVTQLLSDAISSIKALESNMALMIQAVHNLFLCKSDKIGDGSASIFDCAENNNFYYPLIIDEVLPLMETTLDRLNTLYESDLQDLIEAMHDTVIFYYNHGDGNTSNTLLTHYANVLSDLNEIHKTVLSMEHRVSLLKDQVAVFIEEEKEQRDTAEENNDQGSEDDETVPEAQTGNEEEDSEDDTGGEHELCLRDSRYCSDQPAGTQSNTQSNNHSDSEEGTVITAASGTSAASVDHEAASDDDAEEEDEFDEYGNQKVSSFCALYPVYCIMSGAVDTQETFYLLILSFFVTWRRQWSLYAKPLLS